MSLNYVATLYLQKQGVIELLVLVAVSMVTEIQTKQLLDYNALLHSVIEQSI